MNEITNEVGADLYLYGEIGGMDGMDETKFNKELLKLGRVGAINLHVNSPGGDLFAALAIYNLLVSHPAKVKVIIDGLAASAASVIALAGDEVVMAGNSMLMIHSPLSFTYGNAKDLREMADLLDKVETETLIPTYAAKTGMDAKAIKKMLDAETWLSATEAKELGFIDTIGELKAGAPKVESKWKAMLAKYGKTPKALLEQETVTKAGWIEFTLTEDVVIGEDKGAAAEVTNEVEDAKSSLALRARLLKLAS